MKPEKEKWIEDITGSPKDIKRTEASPFLFTRIKEKIKEEHAPARNIIPVRQAWIYVLTFVVLLIFNLDLMLNSSPAQSSEQDIYLVAKSYSLLPENNLYQSK